MQEKLENIFFSNFAIFSGHNRGDDNDERFQEITAQANIEVRTLQSSKVHSFLSVSQFPAIFPN